MTDATNPTVEGERLRRVQQEEPFGCVAACLAMMLDVPYAKAAGMLKRFGDGECYCVASYERVLFDHGWAKCARGRTRADGTRREVWPPEPFAPVHTVNVKVSKDAPVYHYVVWLADGTVLDPLTEAPPAKLADYPHVGGIDGWTRATITKATGGTQ